MSTSNTARGATWKSVLVLAVWAAIYLPGLGTLEIKGEEGRRILPAVMMLQTGNYIVPQIGSDPYFTKPPLVNWLVAASFTLFGQRSEWTARFPSALCVLAVALAFVMIARGALGANGSLAAAIIWLTNFGIIEKGRLIEIEALYASLTGLAIVCWLSFWKERRSKWLTWIVPWAFLGLAMLAKGPVHLLFFYGIVIGVLYRNRELRRLFNVAHVLGIILMLGLFAAWAIPCLQLAPDSNVTHAWSRQFSGRVSGEDFDLRGWVMNIPRGLAYFLPWTILLAFMRRTRFATERDARMASGLAWGVGVSFVVVSLVPGALPRYTMPLLAAAAWLAAMLITAEAFELPQWLRPRWPARVYPQLRLPAIVAAAVCFAIAVYAFAAMPFLKRREKVRNIAAQINAALPPGEPLYAIDPDYQPALFYVRDPIVYVRRVTDLPESAREVLVQARDEAVAMSSERWRPLKARPVLRLKDYRNKTVTLLRISDET
ncbi:MAG: glycosyltransferase family 39 protein [Chthoniobacterales bacterium]|nr:glycosyltransferase family 39 protein [Chthoniobacterales bacterium]